ncbi:uncharacterized protein E0L32_005742 [Thyridium curvatum]|uniref:Gelsolin n=1 Tax=Thyridium curvatum TaxID=1093900 RepID=A0A507BAJ0_9PEZI|nr:uncharacterized protein E0L32_005742 [Thyridium curvatum]TPX13798.1 hypothetical protein E0L32_005742 [Thyridium curvatum]
MSDEVSSFLRSVEQLKDRRDEEDEARSRELEEKILQERRERQARRAERARSISPQKSSPANTPPPSQHRHADSQTSEGLSLASSPVLESTGSPQSRSANQSRSDMMGSADYSTSPTKENESPYDLDSKRASVTSPSSAMPTRTPTLSWQRRPTSQSSAGPKNRPLSMVAAENAAARSSTTSSADQADSPASRDQIAQALGSKDPAWFRQTPDRGQGSDAYRRNQVEDEDRLDMSSVRAQLPGMSRASSTEPDKDATPTRSDSPGLRGKLGSPLPLTPAQRLDPPTTEAIPTETEAASIDRQIMSPPSGRTSPNRPISPTKGMGGFVQSAMMKRTDSVKRWSVTSPTGLQRADSVASARPNSPHRMSGQSSSRPSSMLKESSSRPTSSHADAAPLSVDTTKDTAAPEEPSHPAEDDAKLPVSPSRTMDPRRWSPTKSSWLESALNKPESPKPKPTPPPNSQPSWMADLNKAKAQKATGESDLGRTASVSRNFEVKTGGLMRSSPMGVNVKSPAARSYHSPSPSMGGERTGLAALRGTLSASSSADDVNSSSGTPDKTSATSSPSTSKQKPDTPPKKDFRGTLKSRPTPAGGDGPQQAEFQNVFGNLRRTKTQNYVAPDTLKDNILRGKAGLAVTGGPKPRERKDEFKEAILAKKADFSQAKTEGRGIKTNASGPSEKPIPEGLAKRLEMSRSGSISHDREPSTSTTSVEPPVRTPARSNTMSPVSKRDSAEVSRPTESPRETRSPVPTLQKETSAPARLQKPGGSALADRFNPALAGMLARGPPPMVSNPGKTSDDSSSGAAAPVASQTEQPSGPGPQLTHMTKNRARGPKRKAPTSVAKAAPAEEAAPASAAAESGTAGDEKPTSPIKPTPPNPLSPKPTLERIALVDSAKTPVILPKPATNDVISLVDSSRRKPVEDDSKSTGSKIDLVGSPKPTGRPRSPTKIHEQVAALAAKTHESKSGHSRGESADLTSPATSPRKLDMKRMSKFLDESKPVVEAPRPLSPSKTGGNRPLPEPRPLSPQKTGGRALPESPRKEVPSEKVDSDPVVSVRSGAAMFGGASVAAKPRPSPISPPPKNINLRSPPASASSRPLPTVSSPDPKSPPPMSSPMRSPSKHASEVSAMFNDFFGNARPQRKYTVDAAEVLMSRPKPAPKVRTQQMQLFRLSGDGKKQPVPASYERVLFEREMYLCAHSFADEASGRKAAEVYFWVGDEVPQAAAEDAEVFAGREARALGGKLVKLQQGRESAEFLQALGGIVIVRRGSSNKYDSLAPEMLCGRRYLGQIAFDEVDFSPANLCSGFPYLITTSGKCYLWKGKGSDVDELSCARLIGMDLALMGELTEVEDGAEPAHFWDLFGGDGAARRPGSADHWRLKPNYEKYCGRLFCSDASSRQQIIELHPFSQADLHPAGIYVLDAFFEMYIVVGRRAQSQYASFHNALDFAQEYAILAAGAEDRPFVPVSTVVLEGVPRDLKSVFRKWTDARCPTRLAVPAAGGAAADSHQPVTSPKQFKRGRSLRIVPLNQALQALTS